MRDEDGKWSYSTAPGSSTMDVLCECFGEASFQDTHSWQPWEVAPDQVVSWHTLRPGTQAEVCFHLVSLKLRLDHITKRPDGPSQPGMWPMGLPWLISCGLLTAPHTLRPQRVLWGLRGRGFLQGYGSQSLQRQQWGSALWLRGLLGPRVGFLRRQCGVPPCMPPLMATPIGWLCFLVRPSATWTAMPGYIRHSGRWWLL